MANRTIYLNTDNEDRLKQAEKPNHKVLNLSGLINKLLADYFKKQGVK